MILGLGIDLVEIHRIGALLARWGDRIEKKLFTEEERAYCRARANVAQHFAARFAVKEATLKALGVPRGLSWHEMEVVNVRGAPQLELRGEAAAAAGRLGMARAHLTITHAADMAAAVVVLEGK